MHLPSTPTHRRTHAPHRLKPRGTPSPPNTHTERTPTAHSPHVCTEPTHTPQNQAFFNMSQPTHPHTTHHSPRTQAHAEEARTAGAESHTYTHMLSTTAVWSVVQRTRPLQDPPDAGTGLAAQASGRSAELLEKKRRGEKGGKKKKKQLFSASLGTGLR